MITPESFFQTLNKENIDFYTGVPDSLLKSFSAFIADNTNNENHIIAANEGNAISLGIGYHLATNKIPLIYMQNSGLGNAVNPVLSIADKEVYSIPLLLLIGWRGEPGLEDEPQHKKQGKITLKLLELMEIPYQIITPNTSNLEVEKIINVALKSLNKYSYPYALVVRKGSFKSYQLNDNDNDKIKYTLSREEALKLIVKSIGKEDIVVSTTGVVSRELFEYREQLHQSHEQDFLTVGGMGHANQIALGIALQKPKLTVYCFDGDGAMLMHMGSLAINANSGCNNLKHIIFNNGAHDSVGGQPTVGHQINTTGIAKAVGYPKTMMATSYEELKKSMVKFNAFDGSSLLEVKIKKGFRDNLGRPTTTPIENKKELMKFLNR